MIDIQAALLAALGSLGFVDLKSSDLRYFVPLDLKEGDFVIHLGRYLRQVEADSRNKFLLDVQERIGSAFRCSFSDDYLHVHVPLEVLLGAMGEDLATYLPLDGLEPPFPLKVPAFELEAVNGGQASAVLRALSGLWQAVYQQEIGVAIVPQVLPPEVEGLAREMVVRDDLELAGMPLESFATGILQLKLLGISAREKVPDSPANWFAGRRPEADLLLGLWRMRLLLREENPAAIAPEAWLTGPKDALLSALGPAPAWRSVARACLGLAVQLPQLVYPGKLPWLVHLLLQNQAAMRGLWQTVRLVDPANAVASQVRKHLLHGRQQFLAALLTACGIPGWDAPHIGAAKPQPN